MQKITFISICLIVLLSLNACVKKRCDKKDFEWVYFDAMAIDGLGYYSLSGNKCEYLMWVDDKQIFIESRCTNRGNIIDEYGAVVDTFNFFNNENMSLFREKDTSKKYVWQKWEYDVLLKDSTLFSDVKFISRPIESLKLLSGRSPKRELSILYEIDGKSHTLVLDGIYKVFNITQYDATRFLLSIQSVYTEITPGKNNYYVVMLDLRSLSRPHILGIKL